MSDLFMFLRRFISHPTRVGSVVPSSRFLCKEMMKHVPWQTADLLVELGPGTGVFTQEIMKKKRPQTLVLAVERDPLFRRMLQNRFPGLHIREEAVHLPDYLAELNAGQADAIISGLPFAVFPSETRTEILGNVIQSLAPGGVFVTFQYSLQLKAELHELFGHVDVSFTPLNIPPAFVYTCRK